MVACVWLHQSLPLFRKEDFRIFEGWLYQYIFSWGTCDDFCKRVLNPLFEADLGLYQRILRWTRAGGTWVRRASAVSLIKSRGGGYVVTIPSRYVFEIADRLMEDEDPHVQKGLGWMLKAASISYEKEVYDFVMAHRDHMPRTASRYAIEKMPERMRVRAMRPRSWTAPRHS
jgi:3-methyladenine DNA glycosylase AlkD